jgi:hypothetical protein
MTEKDDPFRGLQRSIFLGVFRQFVAMGLMGAFVGLVLAWLKHRGMPVNFWLAGVVFLLFGLVLAFLFLRVLLPAFIVTSWHPVDPIPMTPERQKAWKYLSDLYLDTELTEEALASMAHNLAELGLSRTEITRIFEHEVAPACIVNMYVVAGEWAAFDEEWLIKRASKLGPVYERLSGIPVYGPWLIRQLTAPVREEFDLVIKKLAA